MTRSRSAPASPSTRRPRRSRAPSWPRCRGPWWSTPTRFPPSPATSISSGRRPRRAFSLRIRERWRACSVSPSPQVQADRIETVRRFCLEYRVHLVLKGARSVLGSPDGRVFINPTGNPGMAKGGSGDVLTGMIGAFLARRFDPLAALQAGCYLHGLAGDLAAADRGEEGSWPATSSSVFRPRSLPLRDEDRLAERRRDPGARRAAGSPPRQGRRGRVHRPAGGGQDLPAPGARPGSGCRDRGDQPHLRARQRVPGPPARLPRRRLPDRAASPSSSTWAWRRCSTAKA